MESKKILKNILFLKDYEIYPAGGTVLTLYFGHRTSRDLDFYTPRHFNPRAIYRKFKEVFRREKISKESTAEDTLKFKINITDLSFFRYPSYPLISFNQTLNSLSIS